MLTRSFTKIQKARDANEVEENKEYEKFKDLCKKGENFVRSYATKYMEENPSRPLEAPIVASVEGSSFGTGKKLQPSQDKYRPPTSSSTELFAPRKEVHAEETKDETREDTKIGEQSKPSSESYSKNEESISSKKEFSFSKPQPPPSDRVSSSNPRTVNQPKPNVWGTLHNSVQKERSQQGQGSDQGDAYVPPKPSESFSNKDPPKNQTFFGQKKQQAPPGQGPSSPRPGAYVPPTSSQRSSGTYAPPNRKYDGDAPPKSDFNPAQKFGSFAQSSTRDNKNTSSQNQSSSSRGGGGTGGFQFGKSQPRNPNKK